MTASIQASLASDAARRPGGSKRPPREGEEIRKVLVGPVGRLLLNILDHYPKRDEIAIGSAYRPQDRASHHAELMYHGSRTAAIDIVATESQTTADVARWLYDNFAAQTVELIYAPSNGEGICVRHQRTLPRAAAYRPTSPAEHHDCVHFASSAALAEQILAALRPG
jgi:hypothetical protein